MKYNGDFSIRTPCKRECCNKSRGEYLGNCDEGGGVYSPVIETLSKTFGRRRTSPVALESSILESEAGLDFRKDECMFGRQSIDPREIYNSAHYRIRLYGGSMDLSVSQPVSAPEE